MLLRSFLAIAIVQGALAARETSGQPPEGNALGLMDAWLALAAAHSASYRTDIRRGGDPSDVPPGRLFFRSPFLGAFTCRPKTYRELTPAERVGVLADPGFRAYLISVREASDREGGPSLPRSPGASTGQDAIDMSPEEALRPQPLRIYLPR